jgi:hypothetical protein
MHDFLARLAVSALLLSAASAPALAQGAPKTMRLEGAPSETGTGALRCAPDQTTQLGLRALDENLNRVTVADYAPQARSTDERVVIARVTENAASTVNVLCVGDGEAWITVEAAGLRADMPVLVGSARRKASPTGPQPELAGAVAAASSPTPPPAPAPVAQVASSTSTPATGTPAVATVASAPSASASAPSATPAATPTPTSAPPTAPATTTVAAGPRNSAKVAAPAPAAAASGRSVAASADGGALPAATGVSAAYVGEGRVAVGWNAVPGASLYTVLYRDRATNQWAAATRQPIAATEYVSDPSVDLALPAGTFDFAVVAQRDAQEWSGAQSASATVNVPRYGGRYRVTVNGFRVVHETLDTPLNGDGQHDEVYVKVAYREYDADGNAVGPEGHAKTKTFGDINAPRWRQPGTDAFRYAAGSASDLGGLVTGNGWPSQEKPWVAPPSLSNETFPLLVWEGYLAEGQHSVAVVPVIYEDDESAWENSPEADALLQFGTWVGARAYKEVDKQVGGITKRVVTRPKVIAQPRKSATELGASLSTLKPSDLFAVSQNVAAMAAKGTERGLDFWANKIAAAQQTNMTLLANLTATSSLLLNTKDRPIGMAGIAGGKIQFDPQVLNISFETAEQIVSTKENPNSDVPAGIRTVRYTDTVPGGNGDYVLYVQVTRLQ